MGKGWQFARNIALLNRLCSAARLVTFVSNLHIIHFRLWKDLDAMLSRILSTFAMLFENPKRPINSKKLKKLLKKKLQSLHVSFAWINPKERILQHPCLIICAHVLMIDDVENGSRVRETNVKVGKVEIDMISWRNFCTSMSKVSKSFTCATTRCSLKKYQQNLHNPQKPKCPPCLLQTVHKAHVEVRQGNVVDVLAKWIFKLLRAAIWLTNSSQSNLISSYLISSHLSLSILTYVILSHLVLSIYRVRISISIFTCSFSTCNATAQSPWQLR